MAGVLASGKTGPIAVELQKRIGDIILDKPIPNAGGRY